MVFIPFEASTSTISFIGLVCGVLGDSRLFQVNKLDEVKVKHNINSIMYISRQLKKKLSFASYKNGQNRPKMYVD